MKAQCHRQRWLPAAPCLAGRRRVPPTASPNTARCSPTATRLNLFEAKGEALWKNRAAPRTRRWSAATWAKGPGVVKGAFVELPRWFADTGKVQDLESRLLTCMETLQGLDAQGSPTPLGPGEQANRRWRPGSVAESRGNQLPLPQGPQERTHVRSSASACSSSAAGRWIFSCASCHGEDGKRIRLQDLPNLTRTPATASAFAAWPAHRVSNGQMWSMQRRLNDCYRQQRFPYPATRRT